MTQKYKGSVCSFDKVDESHDGKYIWVWADSPKLAYDLIMTELDVNPREDSQGNTIDCIEQIEAEHYQKIVYDYMNGFSIYK